MENTDNANVDQQQNNAFNKEEFSSFVKDSLSQIEKIKEAYKKFFESSEGHEPLIKEIETYLEDIKQKYEYLFSTDGAGTSKISELNVSLEGIKKYHQELLEGESSIQTNVKKAQDKITEFYAYLFGGPDTEGQEKKVREVVEEIIDFHTNLTKEDGYKKTIEKAQAEIIQVHQDLFSKDDAGENKVSKLNKNIEEIKTFRDNLSGSIEPFIRETRNDIDAKRRDVAALLDNATGRSLVEGFLKSKKEYKQEPSYKKIEGSSLECILAIFSNILAFFVSLWAVLFDYVLFMFPLLLSVFIFVQPDLVATIIGTKSQEETVAEFLGGLNFYGRLIISLPLWWISWFGQRSISQKRRLAEEYNHKAQVTKMYLNFVAKETEVSYPLVDGAKNKLHDELIEVIARHPGKVYGKDETVLDKIIHLIGAWQNKKYNPDEEHMDLKRS